MADDPPFVGQGWEFPPTFTTGGRDVVVARGQEDVHQSLQIIVGTMPGERVMSPTFGCDLSRMQFEEVDASFVNRVGQLVSDAIVEHEPRVDVNGVDVTVSPSEQGLVLIGVDYTIRTSNSRYNMVFPFYVAEARAPGV